MCLAAAAIIVLGVWLQMPIADAAFSGDRVFLAGPDDYTHVYRAQQVLETGHPRIRHMDGLNAPHGAELHWTAPMDLLLAAVCGSLAGLVRHRDAFTFVAAWIPLFIGVLYLACLMAMMRRAFGWGPALLAGFLAVILPAFHRAFRLGHADHHCLVELLMLISLSCWMPRRRADGNAGLPTQRAAVLSGIATGLAVWVAVQAAFFWIALGVGLFFACLFGDLKARAAYARTRWTWSWVVAIVVFVGYGFENWPDLYVVAVDKISLFHVGIAALAMLVPGSEIRRREAEAATQPNRASGALAEKDSTVPSLKDELTQRRTDRAIAFLATAALFIVWIGMEHGRAFEYVSRQEFYRWSEQVAELQPLYTNAAQVFSLQPMQASLGFLPYLFLPLLVVFARSRATPLAARITWCLIGPLVLGLAITQRRWLDHLNLAVTPIIVIGIWESGRWVMHRLSLRLNATQFLLSAIALCVVISPLLRNLPLWNRQTVAAAAENAKAENVYQERTDFVARIIKQDIALRPADPKHNAILCEDGEGPALLYWTGLPVVASPYHRALDGLLEAAKFFAERDPAAAREQLDRLGVRYIVMPPRAHEQLMQFEKLVYGELRSFDPPTEALDKQGHIIMTLNYRPAELAQTMAYRLVMDQTGDVIPGVKRIAEISEGARDAAGNPRHTGLVYVVLDRPTTQPSTQASSQPASPASAASEPAALRAE